MLVFLLVASYVSVPLVPRPFGAYSPCLGLLLVLLAGLGGCAPSASAQAPLHFVNSETTVREISFRFVDHQTFDTDRLKEHIVTEAPGFLARLRNFFKPLPGIQGRTFPFDPVTLQKDVVRLRKFYNEHGFPDPKIDYPASQLDTTSNRIHVIFTIREGPMLTIRSADFLDATGDQEAITLFQGPLRDEWRTFRNKQTPFEVGERYTEFKRTRIEDNVQSWLRDRGFAFAQVQSEALIDSSAYKVDLRFFVDPGPRGIVSEIQIEGNESVSASVIRRELPFEVGDRFSAAKVKAGQRQLFDLNLFRVALADVPSQPRDSTVVVRYRVREAQLRSLSGQAGYGTQPGVTLEGSWRHRNFYGNARTFIAGVVAETGYPQEAPSFLPNFLTRSSLQDPSRRFRASVTLRQPYILTGRLSGSVAPFVQERINPAFKPNPNRPLSLNERQMGVNTTLVYDLLPFRTISFQHSFSRTRQYLRPAAKDTSQFESPLIGEDDLFNKSVFSLSGTFGKADDFISPSRGYIFRPSLQLGGFFFESGVEFARVNMEISGYLPLSDEVGLAGRLFGGTLRPFDESRTNLNIPASAPTDKRRLNLTYQNRFSDYLFYAGGGSDVRGWVSQLAGGKVLRRATLSRGEFVYRPVGARSKIGTNLEVRLPMPGLSSDWRTAAFVDAAYLTPGSLNLIPPPRLTGVVATPEGKAVATPNLSQLLIGTGAGIRYETSFGFIRTDIAYKLTPNVLDLRNPVDVGNAVKAGRPVQAAPTRFLRRFRLHFGIGRSF